MRRRFALGHSRADIVESKVKEGRVKDVPATRGQWAGRWACVPVVPTGAGVGAFVSADISIYIA